MLSLKPLERLLIAKSKKIMLQDRERSCNPLRHIEMRVPCSPSRCQRARQAAGLPAGLSAVGRNKYFTIHHTYSLVEVPRGIQSIHAFLTRAGLGPHPHRYQFSSRATRNRTCILKSCRRCSRTVRLGLSHAHRRTVNVRFVQ